MESPRVSIPVGVSEACSQRSFHEGRLTWYTDGIFPQAGVSDWEGEGHWAPSRTTLFPERACTENGWLKPAAMTSLEDDGSPSKQTALRFCHNNEKSNQDKVHGSESSCCVFPQWPLALLMCLWSDFKNFHPLKCVIWFSARTPTMLINRCTNSTGFPHTSHDYQAIQKDDSDTRVNLPLCVGLCSCIISVCLFISSYFLLFTRFLYYIP